MNRQLVVYGLYEWPIKNVLGARRCGKGGGGEAEGGAGKCMRPAYVMKRLVEIGSSRSGALCLGCDGVWCEGHTVGRDAAQPHFCLGVSGLVHCVWGVTGFGVRDTLWGGMRPSHTLGRDAAGPWARLGAEGREEPARPFCW
eukprot:306665-Chlamydomonas_euryale.AAC.5